MRVKVRRSDLYHKLEVDQKAVIPKNIPNNQNFFGNITGGNSKDGWIVSFDILPSANKTVRLSSSSRDRIYLLKEYYQIRCDGKPNKSFPDALKVNP